MTKGTFHIFLAFLLGLYLTTVFVRPEVRHYLGDCAISWVAGRPMGAYQAE